MRLSKLRQTIQADFASSSFSSWFLCQECRQLGNQADKLGRTPLILGLLSGAGTEAVEVMLELGEDPRKEDQVASVAYSVLLCRVILM